MNLKYFIIDKNIVSVDFLLLGASRATITDKEIFNKNKENFKFKMKDTIELLVLVHKNIPE